MRQLKRIEGHIVAFIAMGLSVFHLYTGVFGLLVCFQQRAVHVALALTLVFMLRPFRSKIKHDSCTHIPWWDILIIVAVLISASYIFFNYLRFMPFMAAPITKIEIILAILTPIIAIEAARRTVGLSFPLITTVFIIYALWGHYILGGFGHAYINPTMILQYLYLSGDGIWGILVGLSSSYLALFLLFGSFLLSVGGGRTLIDLSLLIAGRFRGGPAKVAVFSSGFFAMLSGSAMANVATTGGVTIPMMKKLGYRSEFAGAVESTASTGGCLTPPVMGAAAFIMAEFLGVRYLTIVVAAIIPAFLFYLSVFMGTHFYSVKNDLRPVSHEDLPTVHSVITPSKMSCLFLPIGVLLYTLIKGYSLTLVGAAACVTVLITYIFYDFSLSNMTQRLCNLPHVLENGGRTLMTIVPILICSNVVLYLLGMTGIGPKFSATIIAVGESSVILSVIMTGLLVMLLGCSLPATAAYVLGIAVAAPLLIRWGILPIAAHLFILYYSRLATLTPPLCPTVFIASSIAESRWIQTAWEALKLAPLLYLMPFLFIFDSTFIMMGPFWLILLNVSTAALGAIILSSGIAGQLLVRCRFYDRLVLISSGILLLIPGWLNDVIGVSLLIAIVLSQILRKRREVCS